MFSKDVWLESEYTKEILREVELKIREIEVNLGSGALLSDSLDKMAGSYSWNVGVIEGLNMFKDMILDDSEGVINEE